MSYKRVIPRDLFNEAGLLKLLGRLSLMITDGLAPEGLSMEHRSPSLGFPIEMDESSGDIWCSEIYLRNREGDARTPMRFLNSRDPWPLAIDIEDGEYVEVFEDNGELTEEFIAWAGGSKK